MNNRFLDWQRILSVTVAIWLTATASASQDSTSRHDTSATPSESTEEQTGQGNSAPADSTAMAKMLEELVVDGYLSSKKTATGEIFRLSKKAKESGDPYLALTDMAIASCNWSDRTYSAIGYTRYLNPITANFWINYRLNNHIQIGVGMEYFGGIRSEETVNSTVNYTSRLHQRFKGESLKPFILISWTIRKNAEYMIDNRMPMM